MKPDAKAAKAKEKAYRAKTKWPMLKLYAMCECFECYEIAREWAEKHAGVYLRQFLIDTHDAGTMSKWESYDQPLNMNMLTSALLANHLSPGEAIHKTAVEIKKAALARVIEIYGVADGLKEKSFVEANGVDVMLSFTGSYVKCRAMMRNNESNELMRFVYDDMRKSCQSVAKRRLEEVCDFVATWKFYYATCVMQLKHVFPLHCSAFEQFIQ